MDKARRYGATGPLSSLQLRWQGANANESGSSGGLLTQAARGKRSRGGLLSGWQAWGGAACSLYLLDFSNWHRGDLNPSQSLQKAKPSPLLQSSTCAPLSSHHAPSPRHHPPPRMTPRSCSFCPTPSLAWLICCHSAWFTGKNKGFGVRKAQHTLTSGVTLGKLL